MPVVHDICGKCDISKPLLISLCETGVSESALQFVPTRVLNQFTALRFIKINPLRNSHYAFVVAIDHTVLVRPYN